jgi:hypothetical protein
LPLRSKSVVILNPFRSTSGHTSDEIRSGCSQVLGPFVRSGPI